MLRISQLPRNAMNVLQSHSKKYFSTKQLAEPELSWELRTWEFFSINKASIQVKQNTNFSENKYPSYTQTWFLFFTHYHIDTLTISCLDLTSQINPVLVLEKGHK